MSRLKPVLIFLIQSVIVGLAAAFVVVLVRPQLLPSITPGGPDSRFRVNTSVGSAVVIDAEGYLVTNYHVVALASDIRLQLADGRLANPEVIGVDEETDLALLKVDLGPLPAIPLGRSDQIRIGDIVLAIGNPYGLSKSVTQGIVSATGRVTRTVATFENFIQTDAAINEGNSGGALINTAGQLVGINTAVLSQDVSTEGIGFAIPVDLVRGVVEEIKQHGRVIRGYVGIIPEELSRAEATSMGLNPNVGIVLTGVTPGSPAEAVGLRRGDVILSINGEQIRSRQQALLIVARLDPGDLIELEGMRNGQRFRTSVTAVERRPQERQ